MLRIDALYCPLDVTFSYCMHSRRNKIIAINEQINDEMRPYICAHDIRLDALLPAHQALLFKSLILFTTN